MQEGKWVSDPAHILVSAASSSSSWCISRTTTTATCSFQSFTPPININNDDDNNNTNSRKMQKDKFRRKILLMILALASNLCVSCINLGRSSSQTKQGNSILGKRSDNAGLTFSYWSPLNQYPPYCPERFDVITLGHCHQFLAHREKSTRDVRANSVMNKDITHISE